MSNTLELNRVPYLKVGGPKNRPYLDYLSPKYLNIAFALRATNSYTVNSSDASNAPGIAFLVYGNRDYWWIICLYNGILDPLAEFVPGSVLQLPDLADVNAFLSTQDAQQLDQLITI